MKRCCFCSNPEEIVTPKEKRRYNGRCIRGWLEFQPKTRIEVSERQAKTCLRPLRYNGGTCNGCTDATFESETKDVFMNARHARMRTADLLSNPIDELWQYTQRLVALCVFRGLLSACLVIAATAYEDVLINKIANDNLTMDN
ncbi:hypothetical protein T4D_10473 [Trichinella pseudospiralis]|uniref:Uncharacterized protein n=1 Tax=Trichinella pseudospiralis TaxID=6337 RepID=A0A0V1FX40_TRIPS|nr:hypothetical protein T4D_10473 [Trichinella pseudospiralis]